MQLNLLATQKEGASATGAAGAAKTAGGGSGGEVASGGAAAAAALPFDVLATAYRRKKLLEALQQGDK